MKALSLTQPWATLVAIGAKKIETRSWRTSYRGPLAIHAAKGFPARARDLYDTNSRIRYALQADHKVRVADSALVLPRGAIVATCCLLDCVPVEQIDLTYLERSFGDYTPGRWGWLLADIKPLKTPIPAKGALGLWTISEGALAGEGRR